eukprot:TRINITY_DN4589_c0_g2_i2.p1 TRINITY_DN4589_c0_g2~~TRINITY_DN4589_c0_g2_i2.p1  ORF type:complete len:850 (+),score=281.95 TRINITY_DN4589_c0_g2_i2:103-2550(+)
MFAAWLCNFREPPFPCAFSNEEFDDDVIPPADELVIGPLPAVGKYVPEPSQPPDRSRRRLFRRHSSMSQMRDPGQRGAKQRRRSDSRSRRRSAPASRISDALRLSQQSAMQQSALLQNALPQQQQALMAQAAAARGLPPLATSPPTPGATPPTPPQRLTPPEVPQPPPRASSDGRLSGAQYRAYSDAGAAEAAGGDTRMHDGGEDWAGEDSSDTSAEDQAGGTQGPAAAAVRQPMYYVTSRVTCSPYSPDCQKGTVLFSVYYQPPKARDVGETPEQINARTHPPVVIPSREITVQGRNPNKALLFKIGTGAVAFKVVLNTFKAAGMQHTWDDNWNVLWTKRVDPWEWANLNFYQRVNHFPGTWGIGRKDQLHRNLTRMRRQFGDCFDITPQTWLLPQDTRAIAADMQINPGCTYILKPCASSCGKGIRLITKLPENKVKAAVVQRYIANPFLIDGRKFDIRLYVALTSVDPLRLYIFDEGLCRFTAERYPGAHAKLGNTWAHLTNYSISKTALVKKREEDARAAGSEHEAQRDIKWALSELRAWFEAQGERGSQQWNRVRQQIEDVVVKTFISIEGEIMNAAGKVCRYPNAHGCFEIFGFDVMLDATLRAYIIEANIMPSLATGTAMDKAVKNRLLAHILTLIGVQPHDRAKWQECEAAGNVHAPASREEYPYRAQGLMAQALSRRPGQGAGQRSRRHEARSFLDSLCDDDRRVILESEAELWRCGGFRRVFPTPTSWQNYSNFFEMQRHYNDLLARWEFEKEREKERIRRDSRGAAAGSTPPAALGPETGWNVPIPLRHPPDGMPPGFTAGLRL